MGQAAQLSDRLFERKAGNLQAQIGREIGAAATSRALRATSGKAKVKRESKIKIAAKTSKQLSSVSSLKSIHS